MKNKSKNLILILFCILLLNLMFTNCGQPQVSTDTGAAVSKIPAGSPTGGGLGYNGGGHSGKLTFLHSSLEDQCKVPLLSLELENGRTRAFSYGCGDSIESQFDWAQFVSFLFDPNFLVYEEKIYANSDFVQLAPNEKVYFHTYCVNPSYEDSRRKTRGLSFAIKYSRFSEPIGFKVVTSGIMTFGSQAGPSAQPLIEVEPGKLRDADASGSQIYQSGGYKLQLKPRHTPTRALGEIEFKESDERVGVECFLKEIVSEAN